MADRYDATGQTNVSVAAAKNPAAGAGVTTILALSDTRNGYYDVSIENVGAQLIHVSVFKDLETNVREYLPLASGGAVTHRGIQMLSQAVVGQQDGGGASDVKAYIQKTGINNT